MFSDLPSDFLPFRQYNITAKAMYQNLIQLHWVDDSDQKTISVEDIYEITDIASLGKNKAKKRNSLSEAQPEVDLTWSPHEDDFVITLDEQRWQLGSVQGYNPE